jgi:hypothetical protein
LKSSAPQKPKDPTRSFRHVRNAALGESELSYVRTTAGAVVVGIGLGTTMPAAQTIVQWAAGTSRLGIATATLSFARSIGGVIGAAVASAILIHALRVLAPSSPEVLSKALSDGHADVAAGALAQESTSRFNGSLRFSVFSERSPPSSRSHYQTSISAAPPVTMK